MKLNNVFRFYDSLFVCLTQYFVQLSKTLFLCFWLIIYNTQ